MEKVRDRQDYHELVKSARQDKHTDTNNDFLNSDIIDRLTADGRLFYELTDNGILFYDDEVRYYNLYYYWNREAPFIVEKKEKPVVIVQYWSGEKKEKQLGFEDRIKEAGFVSSHLSSQLKKNPDKLKEVLESTYEISKYYFDEAGLRLIPPEKKHVKSFWELAEQLEEIPMWHIPYMSDDEIVRSGERGNTICAVDKNDRVCGAISYSDDNTTYGWVGIARDYQKKPGIPMVLYEWSYRRILDRDPNLNGWIAEENTKSKNFHTSIGFTWTGRHKEDWVLYPD